MKLEQLSGCELGRLVNKGEVSPTEVIQYFRKRIEERNPSVNVQSLKTPLPKRVSWKNVWQERKTAGLWPASRSR